MTSKPNQILPDRQADEQAQQDSRDTQSPDLDSRPANQGDSDSVESVELSDLSEPEPEPDFVADLDLIPVESVDGLPVIVITTKEHEVNDQAEQALAQTGTIYQRSGQLVQMVREQGELNGIRRSDSWRITGVKLPEIRERLTACARFMKATDEGLKATHPPGWCCSAITARAAYRHIPRITGLVSSPVLRADGTIVNQPGYDSQTGLFNVSNLVVNVPKSPTLTIVKAAVELLIDIVCDFPFVKPSHKAAWASAVLTHLARFAYPGPAPLFLLDANTRGTGKSLLADLIALIVSGLPASRMTNPRDDDECRKRITALALCGDELVLIDNIAGAFGCPSLDAALTAEVWKDRILGVSEIVELPLNLTWFATGNNVVLMADTSRRICHVRIESPLENPEEREGFKYPKVKEHILANRGKLVEAALTILAGYCAAGRPDQRLKPWGSFEGWSDLVRHAVVWAGLDDPGENRHELAQRSDGDASALRILLEGWIELDPEDDGLTTSQLLAKLKGSPSKFEAVRSAVLELCGDAKLNTDGLPSSQALGLKLGRFEGRVIGPRSLHGDRNRSKVMVWRARNTKKTLTYSS